MDVKISSLRYDHESNIISVAVQVCIAMDSCKPEIFFSLSIQSDESLANPTGKASGAFLENIMSKATPL